jgi:hypothetical protein
MKKWCFHWLGMVVWIVVLTIGAAPSTVSAFKPTAERGHAGMTREGLKPITYRTTDGTILTFSDRAVLELRAGNASVDSIFGELDVGEAHFDNELLPAGTQRLITLKSTVIANLLEDPPNGDEARRNAGRALHTLQDFYAHSNWVNNPGPANTNLCTALGRGSLPALPATTPTCVDDWTCDCVLTGAGLTDLTSGYFPSTPAGKCAHGVLPGAGIHKDTPARTGFAVAEDVAIAGTTDYIRQIINDSRVASNEDAIRAFMDVNGSLAFVIDNTGSMYSDIAGVKTAIGRIVDLVKDDPDLKPDKYVLVVYGDPYVGVPYSTSDATALLGQVNAISVGGGDDCPELAMAGLMRAIDASTNDSLLFLFTDASAKDSSMYPNVMAKALDKGISISAALTGSCSPIDEAYKKLCAETGGQWLLVDKTEEDIANYFNIVEPALSGDLQSILLVEDTFGASASSYSIPVDSTMTSLVVAVNIGSDPYGYSSGTVTLTRPGGGTVEDGDAGTLITPLTSGKVYNLTDLEVGNYTLQVSGTSGDDFSISARGNSPLAFEKFNFVEYQDYRPTEGGLFPIQGLPLAAETQIGIAYMLGPYAGAEFEMIAESNALVGTIDLDQGYEDAAAEDFVGSFDLPAERFRIVATGTDDSGYAYRRVFPTVFLGRSVKVTLVSCDDEMIAGGTFTARFEVTNLGLPDTFTFSAADSYDYVSSISVESATLATNESIMVDVQMVIPDTAEGESSELAVVAQSASDADNLNTALLDRIISPAEAGTPTPATGGGGGGGCFISQMMARIGLSMP